MRQIKRMNVALEMHLVGSLNTALGDERDEVRSRREGGGTL